MPSQNRRAGRQWRNVRLTARVPDLPNAFQAGTVATAFACQGVRWATNAVFWSAGESSLSGGSGGPFVEDDVQRADALVVAAGLWQIASTLARERRVGRVTPCAPMVAVCRTGAHGVTRPTLRHRQAGVPMSL